MANQWIEKRVRFLIKSWIKNNPQPKSVPHDTPNKAAINVSNNKKWTHQHHLKLSEFRKQAGIEYKQANAHFIKLKKLIDFKLRRKGYEKLKTSKHLSSYYSNSKTNHVCRVSDHYVPSTDEREKKALNGIFTWSQFGDEIILTSKTTELDIDKKINKFPG